MNPPHSKRQPGAVRWCFRVLLLAVSAGSLAAQGGYSYSRAITIDHTKVPNTDQSNFPVLFSGTYPYLATAANGGKAQNANGYDIIFTSDAAGTNKLDHELESYSATNGTIIAWVRIPTLSHTTDTAIYIWYGNSAVTTSQENRTGVWDGNYKSVWHLPNGTVLSAGDSTSNGNNGTNSGATATAGKLGGAASLNGSTNYISSGSLITSNVFTISAWIYLRAYPLNCYGAGLFYQGTGNYYIGTHFTIESGCSGLVNTLTFRYEGSTYVGAANNSIQLNTWQHVAVTYSGGTATLYVNGVPQGSASGLGTQAPVANPSAVGYWYNSADPGRFFNGSMDEMEVSSVARGGDWIAAEYNNQSAPATFYSVGSESSLTVAAPTFTPAGGMYSSAQTVTIGTATSGATIRYTIDGGTPTETYGTLYAVPITVSSTATIKAIAYKSGWADSGEGSAVYLIGPAAGGFGYSRAITLDHTKVPNSDQSNFPVLISGTYSFLATVSSGGRVASPYGYDIMFAADSQGTVRLDHEIETYNGATGQINMWVRVPTLSHTSDTVIYVLYGNPGISASLENSSGAWSANYAGVWHLSNGSASMAKDSTSNGYNGNLVNNPAAITGEIGGGASFSSASSQYITMGNNLNIGTNDVTLEVWANAPATPQWAMLMGKRDGAQYDFGIGSVNSGGQAIAGLTAFWFLYNGSWQGWHTTNNVFDGNWHHIVCTRMNGAIAIYVDGVSRALTADSGGATAYSPDNTSNFDLGFNNANSYYQGNMDEARVSIGVARSADWIHTEYNNQGAPASFYSVGPESTFTVAAPTFTPAGGPYGSAQTVSISTTTPGATIHYTNDGSTPTETYGTLYSSAFTVSGSSTTIKAMAYMSGLADSAVTSATYTIINMGTPTLSSPADQSLGQSTLITLTWQAAPNATSYTVYLDTINPPQQHYTVTGATFTPSAALQGSELYYWYVVGNNGSLTGPASATWSFWVTGSPSLVSVTPASGGPPSGGLGTPTSFDFRFSSPNGWQDLSWTEMLFNYYNVGAGACFLAVWPGNGQVALRNDAGSDWLWIGNLGQTQPTPPNSQCSVDLEHSSMTVESPVQIKVTLKLAFYAGLPGPQQIWMQVGDNQGGYAPWQQMGTWTTSTVTSQGPLTVSGTMPAQPGPGGMFTYRASSPNGYGYLTQLVAVFDTAGYSLYPAPHACYVDYNRFTNALTLMSDATGQWDSTIQQAQMGSGTTIQNSQCTVNAGQSSTQVVDANTLQLNLSVTFNQAWFGTTQTDYFWVWDRGGHGAGWMTVGTYAVVAPLGTVATPTFSPAAGTYTSVQTVSIGSTTSGAAIRYTTDGSAPTETAGTVYSGSVTVGSSMTVRAIAYKTGWLDSGEASGAYTITLPPDFTLGTAPGSATVVNGSSALYTVTIGSPNGFSGTVGFTIAGLPTGATAGFNPSTITGSGSTTLTISTATGGPTGTFPLTLTATSGALSHTLYPTLVTQGPPDFTLSATPASISLLAGTSPSAAYTLTVTPVNSFTGTVNFAVSGFPAGTGASFLPPTITGSGSTSLRINSVPWLSAGDYPLTITASSGSLTHTASATLRVQDFSLSISPPSQSVPCNGSAEYTVTATSINGFSGAIVFDSLPPYTNTSESYSPAALYSGSGTTTLTVTTFIGSNCNPITPQVQVSGHTGQISPYAYRYTSANLAINTGSAPDYSITVAPSSSALTPPGNATYTITVNPANGFSGTVGFTASGLPGGVSPSFNSVGNTTTLTLSAAAGTQPGVYPITIGSTSGSLNHSMGATLVIQGTSDFSVAVSPPSQTVGPGGTAIYSVAVSESTGFSGNVSLSATGLPSGATASFSPQTLTSSGASTFTVVTSGSTAVGLSPITITASGGSFSHHTAALLTVSAPLPASMIDPAPGAILAAGSNTFRWDAGGGGSQYQLALGSAPGGSDYSLATTGPGATAYCPDGTLRCQSAAVAVPGSSQQQTVYATLSSLISGVWQSRGYTYMIGPGLSGTPTAAAQTQQGYYAYNNGVPQTWGYRLDQGDARYIVGSSLAACSGVSAQLTAVSSSSISVKFTAAPSAGPGPCSLTLTWYGPAWQGGPWVSVPLTLADAVDVYDASPQITYVQQYPPDSQGRFWITIYGTNFGPSQGTLPMCTSGANPCNGTPDITADPGAPPYGYWSDAQVNALLTPSTNANGIYDVEVNSHGENGNNFIGNPGDPTDQSQSNRGQVVVNQSLSVSMKLQQLGPTVISTDGKYSEDTTIQVTAVRPDTGAVISDFVGTVNIAEDGTLIYSQNGGTLPSSVSIASGGTATFVAKSLAGPKVEGAAGARPTDAQIKTTNYPVYGGNDLAIPQWIISGTQIDPHASGQVYDWFQARAKDIFSSATGDVATVLAAVSTYTVAALPTGGVTNWQRAAQSPIVLNPYFSVSRTDTTFPDTIFCGNTYTKWFTQTLLHEARHAYQASQAAIPGNDKDGDFLVVSIAIAPTTIFLDTTTPRAVCNVTSGGPGTTLSLAYHGDNVFDQPNQPDYASYAWEMDAYVFESSHGQ